MKGKKTSQGDIFWVPPQLSGDDSYCFKYFPLTTNHNLSDRMLLAITLSDRC